VPHLPGRTARPAETVFAALKAGLEECRDAGASAAFAGGLKAFEARYYWEAHELFEAVWMALPEASAEKLFLRGLIQLANAGLKRRMGRMAAAERILGLADAALTEAARRRPGPVLGLAPERVATLRGQVAGESGENSAK
jgi:predicted metal-dependent hydrolase